MDKKEIVALLEQNHQKLFDWLEHQPRDIWERGPEGKWTLNQHILHLVNSLQLLNNALSYPRFFLKYKFGVCNRVPRNYEEVVKKYQEKLHENIEQSKKFNENLEKIGIINRDRLLTRFQILQKKLQYKTRKLSDKNLDTLVIPHPLMGKMTLREIIMWTAYHTEHHFSILRNKYVFKN